MRSETQNILLIMDGYACHLLFRTLSLLKENVILVLGLPVHTPHVLQPLDISVFGPPKEEFRRLLNMPKISTNKEKIIDI